MLQVSTKLEAVNVCLQEAGETTVSALDSGNVDAVDASAILDEITKDVLNRGWHFNTDKEYKLSVESAEPFECKLPTSAIRVDTAGTDSDLDLVERQRKLWDRRNHTFSFSDRQFIIVDVTWLFEFEELPEVFRRYITVRSARLFQKRAIGSQILARLTEQDEQMAWRQVRKYEAKTADFNMLSDSYSVARAVARTSRL